MVMRLVVVFIFAFSLAGCLQKSPSETSSNPSEEMENLTSQAQEASPEVQEEEVSLEEKDIASEPQVSSNVTAEKPAVEDIQKALKSANLYQGKIDGIMGPNTKKAIEDFQVQNSLKVDAKVGPKTWQKLKPFLNR